MNVGGLGQDLKLLGLRAMQDVAEQEAAKYRAAREISDQQSEAKGQAIGGLAGTAVGMGKGFFAKREADHNSLERARERQSEEVRLGAMMQNVRDRQDPEYNLPDVHDPTAYNALDDIHGMFKSAGWAD